jgi:hypothetical protein
MKASAKDIYNEIQSLNPKRTSVSSLGSFVSSSSRMVQEYMFKEIINYLEKDSLAYKILTNAEHYSEKQLWVISYALENTEYAEKVGEAIQARNQKEERKLMESRAKLANNKEASQDVLDYVKANGRLLKDYYSFIKRNRKYSSELYSKKFTMESANDFLSK